MNKISEFFSRKKRISELEIMLFEAESEIERMKGEINNFPPVAISAIPNSQLEEILKSDEQNKIEPLKRLMAEYIGLIEQYDLKADYMFIPNRNYAKFCKAFGCKKSFWGIKVVPVAGLNNTIFISNIEGA